MKTSLGWLSSSEHLWADLDGRLYHSSRDYTALWYTAAKKEGQPQMGGVVPGAYPGIQHLLADGGHILFPDLFTASSRDHFLLFESLIMKGHICCCNVPLKGAKEMTLGRKIMVPVF